VEIQQTRELYFLQRLLYGVAKTITEHVHLGDKYDHVRKVYSISILYFDLGKGADYLYHGQTQLVGVHTHDTLQINTRERDQIKMVTPESIFPEYYIIRVNEFNDVATTPLEEWLEYLKTGYIRSDTTTPGLQEARQKLLVMQMSPEERRAYERHMDNIMVQNDVLETKVIEGREQGREEGRAEGRAEGREQGREEGRAEGRAEGRVEGRAEGRAEGEHSKAIDSARKMKAKGYPADEIAEVTGLSIEEIYSL
jgi:predicted transposase/invertase (TIGR01784 family)